VLKQLYEFWDSYALDATDDGNLIIMGDTGGNIEIIEFNGETYVHKQALLE